MLFCVFKKYGQIDADWWQFLELFDQLFSETDIDEYIEFDIKVVTPLPANDLLMVEWRQETRNKTLREKCPNTELFLVRIFPHSHWIRRDTPYLSVFSLNAGKYGAEKTPYLDTFHAGKVSQKL